MSERDHMRKIFGLHPPLNSGAPQPEPCRICDGRGTDVDYEGLEMKPIEVECGFCHGSGLHNKLND